MRISEVNVGMNTVLTYKCTSAVTDADVNKPVKWSASDTVDLCSDGDQIYGFIDNVSNHLADGVTVVGVQVDGRKWVNCSGAITPGALVEAAANDAVGVVLTTTWSRVSTKALTVDTIQHLADTLPEKKWKLIYGSGDDTTAALIEKQ